MKPQPFAVTGQKSAIWVKGLATYRNRLINLEDAGMRNGNWKNITRREFLEKSAKTAAVVVIASTIPASISRGYESSPNVASDLPIEKRGRRMKRHQGNNYYLSKKSELLKGHDKGTKSLKKILASHFDDDHTNTILMETHQEFESIIPEIPYIGGDENFNTKNLIMASSCLAIYRVLKAHGKSVDEIGKIIYEMCEALVDYPTFILRLIGRLKYGKGYEEKIKRWATESQKRQYPGDWVAIFIEGDSIEFDYGFDMTECGIVKFFHAQGADEITPYICVTMDGVFSKAFNRGLVRTMTLAEGYDRCDFRYKRGRETFLLPLKDGWPPQFGKH
jgi:hypothetical protein